MTTPNERRIRAGYDLFLAADPAVDGDWTPDAPVAALMADDINWFDDEDQPGGLRETPLTDKNLVLGRLRELRSQMPYCQIMSLFEDVEKKLVHTVDHGLKSDAKGERPQLCASSFEFDGAGKVETVRYCSRELHLNSPPAPESTS
jgi:hypothetical protein